MAHPSAPNRMRSAADELQRYPTVLFEGWGRTWLNAQSPAVQEAVEGYQVLRQEVLMAAIRTGSELRLRDFPTGPAFCG